MKAKEQWIQKTMESLDDASPAEVNPYLVEKIISRIQNRDQPDSIVSKRLIWKLSLGFTILVILNIAAIKKYQAQKSGSAQYSSGNEYSFDFNYNY